MKLIGELIQTADWKSEKHVPVIEIPEKNQKGKSIKARIIIGKEIPHPNTTAHHIVWIEAYFKPEAEKFPYCLGRVSFLAHGASVAGVDTSSVYADATADFEFKTDKSGNLFALSYCNIHGLWQNSVEVSVE